MRRTQTSRKRAILDWRKLCGELHCINVVDGGVPYCDEHRRGRTASARRTGHKKVQAFRDMILWRDPQCMPQSPLHRPLRAGRSHPAGRRRRRRFARESARSCRHCNRLRTARPPGRPPASPCSRERRHPPWATAVRSRRARPIPAMHRGCADRRRIDGRAAFARPCAGRSYQLI